MARQAGNGTEPIEGQAGQAGEEAEDQPSARIEGGQETARLETQPATTTETGGQAEGQGQANFSVVAEEPPVRRSNYIPISELTPEQAEKRRANQKRWREGRKGKSGASVASDIELTGAAILSFVNELVKQYLGDECGMNPMERALIEDPFLRVLSKMPPAQIKMLQDNFDPFMLIAGLVSWGYRVYNLKVPARKTVSTRKVTQEATAQANESEVQEPSEEVKTPVNMDEFIENSRSPFEPADVT